MNDRIIRAFIQVCPFHMDGRCLAGHGDKERECDALCERARKFKELINDKER